MTYLKNILLLLPTTMIGMERDIPIIIHNKNNTPIFYKVDEASSHDFITHSNPQNGFVQPDRFCGIQRPFPCYRTIHIDTSDKTKPKGHYEITMIPVKPHEYTIELRDITLTNTVMTKIELIDELEITCKDQLAITINEYGQVLLPEKDY